MKIVKFFKDPKRIRCDKFYYLKMLKSHKICNNNIYTVCVR